jgi:arsenate reductase-like glutaredoxin family protein
MFNLRSPSIKSLGLETEKLSDDELIDLMLQDPRLIRRPVISIDGKTYFGADIKYLEKLLI